jgi:four helix bundle protein
MNPKADQLRRRVKRFAIRVLKFVKALPKDAVTSEVVRQLAGSASGTSSNYHAACRARSRAEFIAKLGLVVEEADETEHWLDVLAKAELASGSELEWLTQEAAELRAIFKASVDTARANYSRRPVPQSEANKLSNAGPGTKSPKSPNP